MSIRYKLKVSSLEGNGMRGDRLRTARELRGYTQSELSELLNLGEKEIWRYENGKSKPIGETVAKIAEMLKVSTDYLLGMSDYMNSDVDPSELSLSERHAIDAWRRGDKFEAIKAIVNE